MVSVGIVRLLGNSTHTSGYQSGGKGAGVFNKEQFRWRIVMPSLIWTEKRHI